MESVGAGPRATIYRAIDTRSGAEVALKVFTPEVVPADAPPEVAAAEKARIETLLDGARLAAAIKHPSVVPTHEVGTEGGSPFIARGFVRGVPIDRWSRGAVYNPAFTTPAGKGTSRPSGIGPAFGPPPSLPDSLTTLYHVCRAVEAAHQQGLVHGNLRPENVLVDSDGRPHLTDFALPPDLPTDLATASNALLGGVSFHAPEVLRRWHVETAPSRDVYSLGAILYTLVTERHPFEDPDPKELYRRARKGGPPPPSARKVAVHQDLDAICMKALDRDRRRRFQSVRELATHLDRFLHHERLALEPSTAARVFRALTRPWTMLAVVVATVACGLFLGSILSQLAAAKGELDRRARLAPLLRQAEALVGMAEAASSPESARAQANAARPAIDRAAAEGPSADAHALLARVERAVGDWAEAEAEARVALAIDPAHPDALLVRAEGATWRAILGGGWPESVCRRAAIAGGAVDAPPPFLRGAASPAFKGDASLEAQAALRAVLGGALREDHSRWAEGCLAWIEGDVARARAAFDEGIARNGRHAQLRAARGAIALAEGQGAAAISDLGAAIEAAPTLAELALLSSLARSLAGDHAAAARDLADAERIRPGWPTARRARVYLKASAGDFTGAGEDAEALRAEEESPSCYVLVAWTKALSGEATALTGLDEACGRWDRDPDLLYARAWHLWRRGDEASAVRAVGDLLGVAPDLSEGHYLSAVLHLEVGEPEAAIGACHRVLEREPSWRAPRVTFVRALMALDREEEALLALDEVLVSAPGDATFQGLRAEALLHRASRRRDVKLRAQDLEEALAAASRAVSASPKAEGPLLLRARVREARADDAGAEADIAEAEKGAPKSAGPPRARAAAHLRKGRQAEALAALSAAAARAPSDPDVFRERAAVYVALGQRPMALVDMNRWIELRPYDAHAWAERGKLHAGVGEKEEARSDLERALELGKHLKDMGPARELLDSLR